MKTRHHSLVSLLLLTGCSPSKIAGPNNPSKTLDAKIEIASTSPAASHDSTGTAANQELPGATKASGTDIVSQSPAPLPKAPNFDGQQSMLHGNPNSKILSSVNLAKYFPKSTTQQIYRFGSEKLYSTYTYLYNSTVFTGLYNQFWNLQKEGFLGTWTKQYGDSSLPATYAQIYFGNDGSATEVGDYYKLKTDLPMNNEFVLFGYRNPSSYTVGGLTWANLNGAIQRTGLVHPYIQGGVGQPFIFKDSDKAILAYNYVWAEELATFQPEFGRKNGTWAKGNGQQYSNVLHLIFYHGTNYGNVAVDCTNKPGNYLKGFYSKVPGFDSYVSEYYLAEGKWIIQERTLYTEDATYWRKAGQDRSDCSGGVFDSSSDGSYGATYID